MLARDLKGKRFGKLVVLSRYGSDRHGRALWWCLCDCGHRLTIIGKNLIRTKQPSRSCGCIQRERFTTRTHGFARRGKRIPEYHVWRAMRQRCRNPRDKSFSDYGGRGIHICKRWNSFAAFLADMGRRPSSRHSLHRIKNDLHYKPSNCRWATAKEQAANRRARVP